MKSKKSTEEIEKLKRESGRICEKFINFYKNNLGMSENDYESFIQSNHLDLPISFRVNKMK